MNEYKVEYTNTEVDLDDVSVDLFKCKELGINIKIYTLPITEELIQNALSGFLEEYPLPLNMRECGDYLENFLNYEVSKRVQITLSTPA